MKHENLSQIIEYVFNSGPLLFREQLGASIHFYFSILFACVRISKCLSHKTKVKYLEFMH